MLEDCFKAACYTRTSNLKILITDDKDSSQSVKYMHERPIMLLSTETLVMVSPEQSQSKLVRLEFT